MNNQLTQNRLKELLHYNPETGVFIRRVNHYMTKMGDVAGYQNPNGYMEIRVDLVLYKSHRLAWLYEYGCFPDYGLDHKDRIRHHNWIDNLREATQQCNLRNTGNSKANKSGCKGVWWENVNNKWRARIEVNGKIKGLGSHSGFDEAVCYRLAAEQCLDWANCDSNSPAFQYVKDNIQKKYLTE